MTEEEKEYGRRLVKADWSYTYSDDHRVYERGRQEFNSLVADYNNKPNLEKMYNEYSQSFWGHAPTPEWVKELT